MGVLLNNTKILINISSISFILLNVYIIYSKIRFNLSTIPFVNHISILIAFSFIISTLLLIYKMVIFARGINKNQNKIEFVKIFTFYFMVILYIALITLFRQENFYFNMNIYSIIFIVILFCLTHFFFIIKFYFEVNKNVWTLYCRTWIS